MEVRHRIPCSVKLALSVMLLLAAVVGPLTQSAAAQSSLVTDFGDNGHVITNIDRVGVIDRVTKVAIDAEGRVLVSGEGANMPSAFTIARLLPDGTLDPNFADDGLLTPGIGREFNLADDGSIYVPGSLGRGTPGTDMAVRRYLSNGQIDRSFGTSGTVRTDMGIKDRANDVFVQPGGDIVVFGSGSCHATDEACSYTYSRIYVVKYSADGTKIKSGGAPAESLRRVYMTASGGFVASGLTSDNEVGKVFRLDSELAVIKNTSFDGSYQPEVNAIQSSGRILTLGGSPWLLRLQADDQTQDPSFNAAIPACPSSSWGSRANSVAVLADNRILTFGSCGMARLDPEGAVDPTFADGGLLDFPEESSWDVWGVSGDGEIVVAKPGESGGEMLVSRFDSDGEPLTEFGDNGVASVATSARTSDRAEAITVDSEGRLIAGGYSSCLGQPCGGFALARYLPNGSLDPAFGGDGLVVTGGRRVDEINALVNYPDGSILAAGAGRDGKTWRSREAFALARYLPSGALDLDFGSNGVVITQASTGRQERSELNAVALQRDRKILVAGLAQRCNNGRLCLTVARYTKSGELDSSFGNRGMFQFKGPFSAEAMAIQPDGRIVVTGGDSDNYFTLRLRPNGSLDRSFGRNGVVALRHRIRFPGVIDYSQLSNAVVIGGNGRITIGGGGASGKGQLFRFLTNGRIDRSFGRNGRVSIPALNVMDISIAKCGLFVTGARNGRDGTPMGLVAMPATGVKSGSVSRIRLPFGDRFRSFAGELIPTDDRSSIVLAGGFAKSERADDFALAKFKTSKLLPGCRL